VSSVTELRRALAICASVRADLTAAGVSYDAAVPIGIMLETPSAVVTADLLAEHVGFFSIGTNDLIQYACAADRENVDVAHLRNPLQPAILRLLKQAIDAAVHAQLPLSVCGDMASNPSFTWLLLGLGLRDFSMEPRAIPAVKAIIRRTSLDEARAFAVTALASPDEEQTARFIEAAMESRFGAAFSG
jgi:phosphotransferase system enzyme I (PtsI)